MENGINGYLHKKFKKQLNLIETKQSKDENLLRTRIDNNSHVPNDSTNVDYDKCHVLNASTTTLTTTSSISSSGSVIADPQSNNTCISYNSNVMVEQNQNNLSRNAMQQQTSSIFVENLYKTNDEQSIKLAEESYDIVGKDEKIINDKSNKYVCTYCNLVCSKPSVLQKHIRAHTNERPYPCISCGFSFKTRSNLYKHCRSRTHANRVMGTATTNKMQEMADDAECNGQDHEMLDKPKPYKPRFHTNKFDANHDDQHRNATMNNSDLITHHINEIISKNNSIINSGDLVLKRRHNDQMDVDEQLVKHADEPLNLTNKNRKRCMSEAVVLATTTEPVQQKSLIKELLLKNLYSDMQCPYCKMIFQTVTELELHKLRSCKGFIKPGAKYSRSNSVNVASILTQNKNAFDGMHDGGFPMKSPGPFLGKTRLVESDKNKSFSFDDGLPSTFAIPNEKLMDKNRRGLLKLFGGEVEVAGDQMDDADKSGKSDVVRSGVKLGGEAQTCKDAPQPAVLAANEYTDIADFSQRAMKLLAPDLKISIPTTRTDLDVSRQTATHHPYSPVNLLVNGKVVRYVPGMPGPIAAADEPQPRRKPPLPRPAPSAPSVSSSADVRAPIFVNTSTTPPPTSRKFARPNSLALKPTSASLKQHHGLTPTMFNQILISPDTPRVAKKYVHQFLHGNYFSYLGLKSSTRPVYCTLNKTQPFYVPHFKKLSMYSEWRQQDTKTDKLYVSGYDSRQKSQKYTMAGKVAADLIIHSSYKFVVSETTMTKSEKIEDTTMKTATSTTSTSLSSTSSIVIGGYECNEDYTYIRGRGRGRYVCDQCGIRCKKPSMLKKHIRTHSNDRPYTCSHCNFSFKTKGNLTKHMKSKAHTKNYAVSNSSSGSSTQQSGTQSSESETEDSGMDSSDESTRREEHEAAYGLLSLSQKTIQPTDMDVVNHKNGYIPDTSTSIHIMDTDEIVHVSQTNYVKNKIMDDKKSNQMLIDKTTKETTTTTTTYLVDDSNETCDIRNITHFLGKTNISRPLTYPYTSILTLTESRMEDNHNLDELEPKSIRQFHVIQRYATPKTSQNSKLTIQNDANLNDLRKRKFHTIDSQFKPKIQRNDGVIDLSINNNDHKNDVDDGVRLTLEQVKNINNEVYDSIRRRRYDRSPIKHKFNNDLNKMNNNNGNVLLLAPIVNEERVTTNMNYIIPDTNFLTNNSESPKSFLSNNDLDNSAMETLADIATKQVKLEKNTIAKNVASEYLKLVRKNDLNDGLMMRDSNNDVNELIVKPEGSKSCTICLKSFSKPSQLRLHMNIHYLERPFRCESCSVSFRTKGHLQKHERSASHHNKLSSSPALSSSEPRPFKCADCNIAFRIHGHLAKHLRSKMHIMKLECLAKIPFGLYAELERSNSLLTEINTADGDQCLESLKTLAKKVFINDPNKLNQVNINENLDVIDS